MEPVKHITLREWKEISIEQYKLSPVTVDRLDRYAKGIERRLKLRVLTRTATGFKAEQVVGILAVPGLTVEILPKIDGDGSSTREALVRMLKVAYDLRIADGEITSLSSQNFDLLEILIRIFSKRLLAAVRRGLPRRYIYHEDDLRLLRGKLDVTRQITKLAVRADVVACRFDELSPDTPLNRVLKAAVVKLVGLSRSSMNRRLLSELQIRFEPVTTTSKPLDEPVRLDRTNTNYHELYDWAKLFLQGDYQDTSGGDMKGISLLFPMNDLFEKFIGNSLKRVFRGTKVSLQDCRYSALRDVENRQIFNLMPDVVISYENGERIVLDTKWKELAPSKSKNFGVSQSDIYQMMAYAHAYKPSRLILLYPWYKDFGRSEGMVCQWKISETNYPLDIATIDVGNSDGYDFHNRIRHALNKITGASVDEIWCA